MSSLSTENSTCIRPVDVNRDLTQIADLIELCFAPHMDEDGRDYIRHIRRAAEDPNLRRMVTGPNERVSLPIAGYVWEEGGRIIGNLSLIHSEIKLKGSNGFQAAKRALQGQ